MRSELNFRLPMAYTKTVSAADLALVLGISERRVNQLVAKKFMTRRNRAFDLAENGFLRITCAPRGLVFTVKTVCWSRNPAYNRYDRVSGVAQPAPPALNLEKF